MFIVKIDTGNGFELFQSTKVYYSKEQKVFDLDWLKNYKQWPQDKPYLFKPYITQTGVGEDKSKVIKVGEFKDFDLPNEAFDLPHLSRIVLDDVVLEFNGDAYICNENGKTLERILDCSYLMPKEKVKE